MHPRIFPALLLLRNNNVQGLILNNESGCYIGFFRLCAVLLNEASHSALIAQCIDTLCTIPCVLYTLATGSAELDAFKSHRRDVQPSFFSVIKYLTNKHCSFSEKIKCLFEICWTFYAVYIKSHS